MATGKGKKEKGKLYFITSVSNTLPNSKSLLATKIKVLISFFPLNQVQPLIWMENVMSHEMTKMP